MLLEAATVAALCVSKGFRVISDDGGFTKLSA